MQTAHVVAEFAIQFPHILDKWHKDSQFMVALEAPDETTLHNLKTKASQFGISVTEFREPDIGNQVTALAFEPNEKVHKLLSNYPLAGKKSGVQS